MFFGRKIEGEQTSYWGARAIYKDCPHDIDILPDRQGGETNNSSLLEWLNKRALPWLRNEVRAVNLDRNSNEVLRLQEFKYVLEACPNQSHGYLYIGAAERPVVRLPACPNSRGVLEKVWGVGGRRFVWNQDRIFEPAETGTATVNKLGKGTVVGYHSEPYGDNLQLLCLLVQLDNPPKWWKDQTQRQDLVKMLLGQHGLWLRPKWGNQLMPLDETSAKREIESLVANYPPSKLFNRDCMAAYKKWVENYDYPPAIIWDCDFKA